MTRAVLSTLLVVASSCAPDTPPAVSEPLMEFEDAETTEDTAVEPGEEDTTFRPEYVGLFAEFAVDSATGYAVAAEGYDSLGLPTHLPIRVVLVLADESLASGVLTGDTACHVTLEYDGAIEPASWVAAAGAWTGWQLPAEAVVSNDDSRLSDIIGFPLDPCSEKEFEGSWGSDPIFHVSKWTWGFGLHEISTDTLDELEAMIDPQQWEVLEPSVVGGGTYSDLLEDDLPDTGGYLSGGMGIAFAVDEAFQLQIDATGNPSPLLREEVYVDDNLATALYNVQGSFIGPASILTQ